MPASKFKIKMKKSLFILFLLTGLFVLGQQSKKVFFVGNSYTSTGNIPNLVKLIAADSGDELIYAAHTPGGATFQNHASNPTVTSTISQGDWDYVVLQEQSQLPSFPMSQVEQQVLPYAEQLSEMVKQHNPCAQVAFYMTWGRKNGDSQNCSYWPPVCTYDGMDDLLYERYMLMAELNSDIVSPVGRVWRYIRNHYPSVELYSGDGSHPSAIGSMAAAYTFYTVIFKNSPYDSNYSGSISSDTMDIVREAVNEVVFNNPEEWYLNDYLPSADFEFDAQNLEVTFTDLSENSTGWHWDFGDGNTSEEQNPVHIYTQPGNYTVRLTSEKCSENDFTEKTVTVESMSVSDVSNSELKIYPNPVKDLIYLDAKEKISEIRLYDLAGKYFGELKLSNQNSADLSSIVSGIYLLKVKTETGIYNLKFVKK